MLLIGLVALFLTTRGKPSPAEGGRYECNGTLMLARDVVCRVQLKHLRRAHMLRPNGRFLAVRFLATTRFFAWRGFVILRAAGPASWTARHMYQLATVR